MGVFSKESSVANIVKFFDWFLLLVPYAFKSINDKSIILQNFTTVAKLLSLLYAANRVLSRSDKFNGII